MIPTVLGWTFSLKNRGDRAECLAARAFTQLHQIPLISSVVAPNPYDFAIANALMRLDSDKSRDLHSNGDANNSETCSLFHYGILYGCRTTSSLLQYPSVRAMRPLQKGAYGKLSGQLHWSTEKRAPSSSRAVSRSLVSRVRRRGMVRVFITIRGFRAAFRRVFRIWCRGARNLRTGGCLCRREAGRTR